MHCMGNEIRVKYDFGRVKWIGNARSVLSLPTWKTVNRNMTISQWNTVSNSVRETKYKVRCGERNKTKNGALVVARHSFVWIWIIHSNLQLDANVCLLSHTRLRLCISRWTMMKKKKKWNLLGERQRPTEIDSRKYIDRGSGNQEDESFISSQITESGSGCIKNAIHIYLQIGLPMQMCIDSIWTFIWIPFVRRIYIWESSLISICDRWRDGSKFILYLRAMDIGQTELSKGIGTATQRRYDARQRAITRRKIKMRKRLREQRQLEDNTLANGGHRAYS